MAAKPEGTVSLKNFVDKKSQRVVLAESDMHFVDILLSFLTLPMGTIVRLVGKQSPEPAKIGFMNNLYESVENLSKEAVLTETCKDMLHRPRNMWENHLRNLKVNVDDSEATKFFICPEIECNRMSQGALLSNYNNARCSCGELMNEEITFEDSDVDQEGNKDSDIDEEGNEDSDIDQEGNEDSVADQECNGEVFISGEVCKFIITDDLKVMLCGLTTSIQLLRKLGIKDVKQLDEQTLNLGLSEILNLLKHSMISKSPLTDVFLPKQGSKLSNNVMYGRKYQSPSLNMSETVDTDETIFVKLLIKKSEDKVFYAEAREDFVDFLFSLLTIPLGTVLSHLGGNSELGCVDNLHNTLEELNGEWFVELKQEMLGVKLASENAKVQLLYSGVAPKVSCQIQPLNIREEAPLQYYCYSKLVLDEASYHLTTSDLQLQPKKKDYGVSESVSPLTLTDPRTPAGGFVTRPAVFMVSNDLKVTPMSSYSVSFLKTLECSIFDVEERTISIGYEEAMNLLKAALISSSPQIDGLNLLLKNPKQEK